MSVEEYHALLCGINDMTPLGHIVRIRAENKTSEIVKMTSHERKIRSDWQKFRAERKTEAEVMQEVNSFQQMLKAMFS